MSETLPASQDSNYPAEVGGTTVLDRPDSSNLPEVPTPSANELEEMLDVKPPTVHDDMTDEELKKALNVQVVDMSHGVAANAVDYAEDRLNERKSGFFSNMWKSVTDRGVIRAIRRQHFVNRGRNEILETGDLNVHKQGTAASHQQEDEAVVSRFALDATSEYDLLHEGETNDRLDETGQGREFAAELRNAVRDYAAGRITEEELQERGNAASTRYGETAHPQDRNRGLLYKNNLLTAARHARAAAEHGVAMDRIDQAIGIHVGPHASGLVPRLTSVT